MTSPSSLAAVEPAFDSPNFEFKSSFKDFNLRLLSLIAA